MTATSHTIKEDYVDHGFGFPVIIDKVAIKRVGKEEIPLINYDALECEVVRVLPEKPSPLSGAEVRFIRLHFSMTLKEFASHLNVTHPAVLKWERKGQEPTGMSWVKEKNLRLFVERKVAPKRTRQFAELYDQLEQERKAALEPIRVHDLPAPAHAYA